MVKTRSQNVHPVVKEEPTDTKNVKKTKKSKYTRYRVSKIRITQRRLPTIKLENEDDNKQDLLSSPAPKSKRSGITDEQIAKVIGYILNDKMSIKRSARKAGVSADSAHRYYQEYLDDPERKIPLAKTRIKRQSSKLDKKKVEDLIHYIVHDNLNITQAAYKAKISRPVAAKYYRKYKKDPEHKIPALDNPYNNGCRSHPQEKIKELIDLIVQEKMSLWAASKKTGFHVSTATRFYLQYVNDPNHKIPVPGRQTRNSGKVCTNEKVKAAIGHIVDDGLSIMEASVKAGMSHDTVRKYYNQYVNDPDHKIPTPESTGTKAVRGGLMKRPTLEQVNTFFRSLLVDKLNVNQASKKANISNSCGLRYQKRYLESISNETKVKVKDTEYSPEKMEKMLEYMEKDKMTMKAAAIKANMNYASAQHYYLRYKKDPQHRVPSKLMKRYTYAEVKNVIGYIENEKMNFTAAAEKANMKPATARRYYKMYLNDPDRKIPVPAINGITTKNYDFYTQLKSIADVYYKNSSIKTPENNNNSLSDSPDIGVKKEVLEEDIKMILKD